jgi:hypothetical protein
MKDTGVVVESVTVNITPIKAVGYARPTSLLVGVDVRLEEL